MSNEKYRAKQLPMIIEVFDLDNSNSDQKASAESIADVIERTEDFASKNSDVALGLFMSYYKYHLN